MVNESDESGSHAKSCTGEYLEGIDLSRKFSA